MSDNTYTLMKACTIVRRTDDSVGRMKVFMSVLQNSRSIRYSYSLYQKSPDALKAVLVVVYGLKCHLSLRRRRDDKPQLLYFASYPNEHRVLRHVRHHLGDIDQGEITISLANCFRMAAISDFVRFVPASARLYRFARRLVSRHDFMPACRIFSTVTYYMRFGRLLDEQVRAVFIACQYSPECLGLAAAAQQARKKVFFTNHASASGETGFVPPIYADLVAVTSEAMADIYRRHSPRDLNIVPITIPEKQQPMRIPRHSSAELTVGIYLTALTNEARLTEILSEWSTLKRTALFFIRTHPAQVVNPDLSSFTRTGGTIEVSEARPLSDDIARTDIAICGNSTVAVEILRGGRPVLYDHRLDDMAFDYNGYSGRGLLLSYPTLFDDKIFDKLLRHYGSADWAEKMRYYDSSYQADEQKIMQGFSAAVLRTLQQEKANE